MKIKYTASYNRGFGKLCPELQELVLLKIERFTEYSFHMGLKAHKLHGRMADSWAFSINHKYRIVYKFIGEDTAYLLEIGTHDIYD